MIKDKYNVIGVMSGTSLDGIDLVYATFDFDKTWQFKIHHAETKSYSKDWIEILQKLVTFSKEELGQIDKDYTLFLSTVIINFINKFNIKNLDAICSHGHTALHQPEKGLTYQIGNLPIIAELLQHLVICDFRVQDVELGGQGAPLVPIGDQLLFSKYDYCLNLGGFANISSEVDDNRIAYDICPANNVLNYYAKQLGFDYDDEGKMAATGKIDNALLNKLNSLKFYKQDYPKSLGYEWIQDTIIPLIESFTFSAIDILRTFVEHIAVQISKEINLMTSKGVQIIKCVRADDFDLNLKQIIEFMANHS